MASIFTWESDTPRVSSPWLQAIDDSGKVSPAVDLSENGLFGTDIPNKRKSSNKIARLQAEPQEGPVEYKLHLMLRPRRRFKASSTGTVVAGSRRTFGGHELDNASEPNLTATASAYSTSTQQTRQHRFQQLTTQLLWRLQQSSPHHSSSATNFIVPTLPDAFALQTPQPIGKLLHGLEESQGALYEIGVSDDGTLVGLAEDELEESLHNLRAMAACLGCTVEVLRKQVVGHCEWIDDSVVPTRKISNVKRGPLLIAEAMIRPHFQAGIETARVEKTDASADATETPSTSHQNAEQLRITLTGPTMCGKSTLLGTLTTSTLDSGRGTSRLSMLKHRHEITSGITSSVAQELFGYQDLPDGSIEVINYATENVASWIDIHAASAGSRLVFVSDSAGHPRYRRTTVRSLVGWAPHWTLFCVPANDSEDIPNTATNGISDIDLADAQLGLCLRLGLPLVVVLTKLDVATRTGLKNSLTRVLDALKAAGRRPAMVPTALKPQFDGIVESELIDKACDLVVPLLNDPIETVPVILTSAVEGTGINNLHALLHELPIPTPAQVSGSMTLFHVEDVYSKPVEISGIIVSGHLQAGRIKVGDEMVLGPFSLHDGPEDSDSEDLRHLSIQTSHSRSFPGALHTRRDTAPRQHSLPGQEWKRWVVTSIRNLRLPSYALLAGQVGTIGIAPCDSPLSEAVIGRIRKGMVLTHVPPSTTKTFVAEFDRQDLEAMAVGNHVVVYISSIRAPAKIVSARVPDNSLDETDRDAQFTFDDDIKDDQRQLAPVAGAVTTRHLHVTFAFESGREFLMLNDKILVMPGGSPSISQTGRKVVAGLDGFVGKIVELVG